MLGRYSATHADSPAACGRAEIPPGAGAGRVYLAIGAVLATMGGAAFVMQQPAAAQSDRGTQLAAACAACHRVDGRDRGIAPIAGASEQHLVHAMLAYKSGQRDSLIMRAVARSLSDQDIAAVAHHFATLRTAAGPQ